MLGAADHDVSVPGCYCPTPSSPPQMRHDEDMLGAKDHEVSVPGRYYPTPVQPTPPHPRCNMTKICWEQQDCPWFSGLWAAVVACKCRFHEHITTLHIQKVTLLDSNLFLGMQMNAECCFHLKNEDHSTEPHKLRSNE